MGPVDRIRRWFAAEIAASPAFGVDPGDHFHDVDWRVALFDDVRGLVGDAAIEALPDVLGELEGVEQVEHLQREYTDVVGTVTAAQVAAFVVAELARTGDPDYWTRMEEQGR